MKAKMIAAAFIALVLGVPAAQAENFYVLGTAGHGKFKGNSVSKNEIDAELVSNGVTGLSSSLDDTDVAYKLQLGYRINKYFAVEGGYFDLGKLRYKATFTGGNASATAKADGWNLTAVGSLPIADRFALFAKAGAIRSTAKADMSATGPGAGAGGSGKDTKWGTLYGVGASYDVTQSIALRAEYEVYDKIGDSNNSAEFKVNVWSMGVAYKF